MLTITEIINSDTPTLVDFFAEWCGLCKVMSPILKEVKDEEREAMSILKVDVDKNPSVSQQYQVQAVPTLISFKQGKILWRQSGVVAKSQLLQIVK